MTSGSKDAGSDGGPWFGGATAAVELFVVGAFAAEGGVAGGLAPPAEVPMRSSSALVASAMFRAC